MGKPRLFVHPGAKKLIKEFRNYSWGPKKRKRKRERAEMYGVGTKDLLDEFNREVPLYLARIWTDAKKRYRLEWERNALNQVITIMYTLRDGKKKLDPRYNKLALRREIENWIEQIDKEIEDLEERGVKYDSINDFGSPKSIGKPDDEPTEE